MKIRRSAAAYYAIQGAAVCVWWIVLFAFPESQKYFALEPDSRVSLIAFWLPDIVLIAGGSIVAAFLTFRNNKHRLAAAWFATGAVSYAALYCLMFAYLLDHGWLGVTLMLPAMIWSGVFAVGLTFDKEMFRKAADTSTGWILLKTYTQIVVVWSIILVIIPYLITLLEDRLGIARFQFAYQKPIAAVIFAGISLLGILSAYTMSRVGQGTPLPLDHAKNLVILGTYAYVRNPMALSGIGQGLAVALFLGSPLVAAYAFMGSLIWQLIFRPLEEDDLRARFGTEYKNYCREVKCWIPRTTRYQSDGAVDSSISIERPSGSM